MLDHNEIALVIVALVIVGLAWNWWDRRKGPR